jgi:hydrogenase-4 component E
MINLLIIVFTMTLTYIAIANRFDTKINLLILQGILLFGIAFLELKHIDAANLAFILSETVIFKAIIVPYILFRVVKRNELKRDKEVKKIHFSSIFAILFIVGASFALAHQLHNEHLNITYFTASVSTILTGIYLISFRHTVLAHVIGFTVLENGIFLFSLALGSEMPMMVNIGILLDLFTSTIILSLFINRIAQTFKNLEVDNLTELKD